MNLRLIKYVFQAAIIFAFLIGCQAKDTSAPTSSDDQAIDEETNGDELEEIEITVTHFPATFHGLPYAVAMDEGFFEEEGIKVTGVVPGDGGGTTVRNLLEGDLAFGDVALPAVIKAIDSGSDLMIVGGGVKSPNDVAFVTRNEADFETIEDLQGNTWGFINPGSVTQALSYLAIENAGLDLDSFDLVSVGGIPEGKTLLKQEEVDLTIQAAPNITLEKDDYKTVALAGDYVPDYQQTIVATKPEIVENNPELIKNFLAAIDKAHKWMYENPEEAGLIYAKYAEIDEDGAIEATKQLIELNHWDVQLNEAGLDEAVKGMRIVDIIEKDAQIPWDEIVDQSFLAENKQIDFSQLSE